MSILCSALVLGACTEGDPLVRARSLQDAGAHEESLEPLRSHLADHPDDSEAQFLYGRALTQMGLVSQGAWSLEKAMEDPEWRSEAGLQLAHATLRSGNYNAAIDAASQVLADDPEHVEALLVRAESHAFSRVGAEDALADVERVLELDPDNNAALRPKIVALLALERGEEAGEAIAELGERIRDQATGSQLEGWHCAIETVFAEEDGRLEDAGSQWDDCLERFPGNGHVVSNAVTHFEEKGDLERSIQILQTGLEAEPDSREFRTALASRLRAAGRVDEAEQVLRQATETENRYEALLAWLELAEHHQAAGDYGQGVEAADRAMEVARAADFDHPQLLFEYADALMLADEFDRALAVADETTVEAHAELIRARVAQARGQYREALDHYAEAFELWPNNADARFMAALAAEVVGDIDRAIEEYRYAVRLNPDDVEARKRAASLYAAQKEPVAGLRVLRIRELPLDFEGELLSLELLAQSGGAPKAVIRGLNEMAEAGAPQLALALASVADGLAARGAPGPAADRLLQAHADGFSLEHPTSAPALRALVRHAHRAGRLEEVRPLVERAARDHPKAAVLQEIWGWTLELGGAPEASVREAFERALAQAPRYGLALQGLARQELAANPARALELFERAVGIDSDDLDARLGAAQALIALDRSREAEEQLAAALRSNPYEAKPAVRLARLQLARGEASDATLSLAQRAARFAGGLEAIELLARVHRERGEDELADRVAERAAQIRDAASPDA